MNDAALITFMVMYSVFIVWLLYESSPAYRTKQRRKRFFAAFSRIVGSANDGGQRLRELKVWYYHASSLNPSWLRDIRDLSTLLSDLFYCVRTYGTEKAKKNFGVELSDDHTKIAFELFNKLDEEQPYKSVPPPFAQHLAGAKRALIESNIGLGTDALNHLASAASRLSAEAFRSKRYFYITLAVSIVSVALSIILRFI